jgi:DNA repair protein RadC
MRGTGDSELTERLWRQGIDALSESELLELLFGERTPERRSELEALHLGGLKALFELDPYALASLPGMGPRRAGRLLAAVELGRRSMRLTERRPRLRTPAEIDAWLRPHLTSLRREVFHVLCFNARNVLLRDARVAEGSTSSCPVDPSEVFRAALSVRASAVVLAHNHPSGDPEPSGLDLSLTRQLVEGGRLLNVQVMDHLIIGERTYVSLLERGLMPHLRRSSWQEAS